MALPYQTWSVFGFCIVTDDTPISPEILGSSELGTNNVIPTKTTVNNFRNILLLVLHLQSSLKMIYAPILQPFIFVAILTQHIFSPSWFTYNHIKKKRQKRIYTPDVPLKTLICIIPKAFNPGFY